MPTAITTLASTIARIASPTPAPGPRESVGVSGPTAASSEGWASATSAARSGEAAVESGLAVASPDADAATDGGGDVAAALGRDVAAGAVVAAFTGIGWIET
jgi:hypothetical protein